MREDQIENRLVRGVKRLCGMCEKFTSPGRRSVPDRLITLPGGAVIFVECKRPGGKPTANQTRDHERRRRLGAEVYVVSTPDEVQELIDALASRVA